MMSCEVSVFLGCGAVSLVNYCFETSRLYVGPSHHGMARPWDADGGTASNMEGSCE